MLVCKKFPNALFFLYLNCDLSRRLVQGLCNKLDIFWDIIISGLYIRKLGKTIKSSGLLVLGCHDTTMIGGFSTFGQKDISSSAENMAEKA